mgnify:CR=1 FL=1
MEASTTVKRRGCANDAARWPQDDSHKGTTTFFITKVTRDTKPRMRSQPQTHLRAGNLSAVVTDGFFVLCANSSLSGVASLHRRGSDHEICGRKRRSRPENLAAPSDAPVSMNRAARRRRGWIGKRPPVSFRRAGSGRRNRRRSSIWLKVSTTRSAHLILQYGVKRQAFSDVADRWTLGATGS